MYQSIGKKKKKIRKRIDPYRAAQARQRKAANEARQAVLQTERKEAMGDSIRSKPTPFIESLKSTGLAQDDQIETVVAAAGDPETPLNFFLTTTQLGKSLEYSKYLTEPLPPEGSNNVNPEVMERELKKHAEAHENARRALAAITALENGSSKDRMRVNIQRCIQEFGRHRTDQILPLKPASSATPAEIAANNSKAAKEKRVGPDTGSSEVQAAILTTKINTLADNLHKKDKHNKRNLRVLVHKRQKLLSYLRRRERGGPRWQHLVEKLGISDAMWKGEISL
jgi:ribosomal protein S15